MADEIVSPARSLHVLAEKFLDQYLQANPDTQLVRVCCQAESQRGTETKAVDVAAQACIDQIQERIEITEGSESPVIIRRTCHRSQAAFLAGTKRDGSLIWTHSRHLALVLGPEDAAQVSLALQAQDIRVSIEPLTRAQAQICAAELADLEREAKRPLSQEQAQRYRLRRLKTELIAKLLERGR